MALAFFDVTKMLLFYSPNFFNNGQNFRRLFVVKRFHSVHKFLFFGRSDFCNDTPLFADGFLSYLFKVIP